MSNKHSKKLINELFFFILVASEVLHDLQQMCQDADKRKSKTTNFLSDLEKNAEDKGFTVSDNPGEGDCMFYALSEQLELVKRIKLSVAELRKELVQYLKEHPKLVSI